MDADVIMYQVEELGYVPIKNRCPFLYLEHGKLCVSGYSFQFKKNEGYYSIPCCMFTCLLIGPGVSVTTDAVALASKHNVLVMWIGEGCTKIYSSGLSSTKSSRRRLLLQCATLEKAEMRFDAISRLYELMFEGDRKDFRTVEQYRGHEGAKVRHLYAVIAHEHKIRWKGMKHADEQLQTLINVCNGCLYALCEAVCVVAGFHTGVGVVPLAFSLFNEGVVKEPFSLGRKACRDLFLNTNLDNRIFKNLHYIYNIHA